MPSTGTSDAHLGRWTREGRWVTGGAVIAGVASLPGSQPKGAKSRDGVWRSGLLEVALELGFSHGCPCARLIFN